MLLALVAVPLVVLWYRRLQRERAARRARLAALGLVAPRRGARRVAATPAARAAAARAGGAGRGPGPAGGDRAAAPPRGHGDPRLRRVGQHGRQGPRAEPDRRREGRRAHVRAEAADDRAGGRRGVQRQRAGHPGAHHATRRRCSPRSTASPRRAAPRSRAGCRRRSRRSSGGRCCSTAGPATRSSRAGRTSGYHGSAAVILLSDGENTAGRRPARRRRHRVRAPG